MKSWVDFVSRTQVLGWACDPDRPDHPLRVQVLVGDVVVETATADRHRPDLERAGIGDGAHGFEVVFARALPPHARHVVRVRAAETGQDLDNSVWTIEPDAEAPVPAGSGLRGYVDHVARDHIVGWALNDADPDRPVVVEILDNDRTIAHAIANRHRADLAEAAIGNAHHGFELVIPGGLTPLERHVVRLRFDGGTAELDNSPQVIDTPDNFGPALQAAIASALDALPDGDAQAAALAFLARRIDSLRDRPALPESPRALVIDAHLPHADDGGARGVLSHVRALRRLGYSVTLAGAEAYEASHGGIEDLLRRAGGAFDVVYLHRAAIAARYLALARHAQPTARILYSVGDLHHLRLQRQAAVEDRADLFVASQRLQLSEYDAAANADAVLTHSLAEADRLRAAVPLASVHHVAWDVAARPPGAAFAARRGIAFLADDSHPANADAAHWLAETIMPLVWAQAPDIVCTMVGPALGQVRALPNLVVRDQVGDLLDHVRLGVAPLRYGAGVAGKIVDGLAAGVPCVMTPFAAEGLKLTMTLRAFVAADAEEFAGLICRLHEDEKLHDSAMRAGHRLIRSQFSEEVVHAALKSALGA